MKKTLPLLVASTALCATLGLPAWSGPSAPFYGMPLGTVTAGAGTSNTASLLFVSDDDDEGHGWLRWLENDDDDDGAVDTGLRGGLIPPGQVPGGGAQPQNPAEATPQRQ